MSKKIRSCSVENCKRKYEAKGFCEMHYKRWKRNGIPGDSIKRKFSNPEEAFRNRVEQKDGCLVWTGYRDRHGYGQINVGGSMTGAHRFAYEIAHGAIPEGLHIDHMCWNPSCVNVEHLRVATNQQNLRNRSGAQVNNVSSGVRNVYRHWRGWQVQLQKSGKYYFFGTYPTIEEASVVAAQARAELFGVYSGKG